METKFVLLELDNALLIEKKPILSSTYKISNETTHFLRKKSLTLHNDTDIHKTNTETNDRQGVHPSGLNSVQSNKI